MFPKKHNADDTENSPSDNEKHLNHLSDKYKNLERPQKFSSSPQAFDAVFFSGANQDGMYFVIATERRPNNFSHCILYFMVGKNSALEQLVD